MNLNVKGAKFEDEKLVIRFDAGNQTSKQQQ
jgi:hypothetical protein